MTTASCRMSRRRQLSDEERALWTGLTHSITPLRLPEKSTSAVAAAGEQAPAAHKPRGAAPRAKPPLKPPPLAPLGRRLKRRVARGREPIDSSIDLHGLTQGQAHAALLKFLERSLADGAKIVLIVTGKGTDRAKRDSATECGILRRQVPRWLSLPEFRPLVAAFENAHVGHGGEGALYVRLRRQQCA